LVSFQKAQKRGLEKKLHKMVSIMLEVLNLDIKMVMEFSNMTINPIMKGSFIMILKKGRAFKSLNLVIRTLDSSTKTNLMEKVSIFGLMGPFTEEHF
jgi:hypothetical protein